MMNSPKTKFLASGGIVTSVVIGTIVAIVAFWSPHLKADRATLAEDRAAITAIQRQQANLTGVSQQLNALKDEQTKLNEDVWAFSDEDTFYNTWDPLGDSLNTNITIDSVSDATPGLLPVRRDATVTVVGSMANVWRTIQAIPKIQPVVVIQDLDLEPGDVATTVLARITVSTLWYDDTIR